MIQLTDLFQYSRDLRYIAHHLVSYSGAGLPFIDVLSRVWVMLRYSLTQGCVFVSIRFGAIAHRCCCIR